VQAELAQVESALPLTLMVTGKLDCEMAFFVRHFTNKSVTPIKGITLSPDYQ
jgi:hypothetical protein